MCDFENNVGIQLFDPQTRKKRKNRKITKSVDNVNNDATYEQLLDRAYVFLEEHVRKEAASSIELPPCEVYALGTKRTVWGNFARMCKILGRVKNREHFKKWIFCELQTIGYEDKSHLILMGRYTAEEIDALVYSYLDVFGADNKPSNLTTINSLV
eukprot:TRINITY_DN2118_c0_g1_i1.p1 TRINITY_DN2118_c0_g1~~TRINITY_DN2118_c0_g1_i1.p1  ORF type:complete len:156 (+),score=35.37 TRINITY_DN2118_c0_g1_i1:172-639(+)